MRVTYTLLSIYIYSIIVRIGLLGTIISTRKMNKRIAAHPPHRHYRARKDLKLNWFCDICVLKKNFECIKKKC